MECRRKILARHHGIRCGAGPYFPSGGGSEPEGAAVLTIGDDWAVIGREVGGFRAVTILLHKSVFRRVIQLDLHGNVIWCTAQHRTLGKIFLTSFYLPHSGKDFSRYEREITNFRKALRFKARGLPIFAGGDANCVLQQLEGPEMIAVEERGRAFLEATGSAALHTLCRLDPAQPSHIPYSDLFQPNTLDYLLSSHRALTSAAHLRTEFRDALGSDHQLVAATTSFPAKVGPSDSHQVGCRRWASSTISESDFVELATGDISTFERVAAAHATPRQTRRYRDSQDIKDLLKQARSTRDPLQRAELWKHIYGLRRLGRKAYRTQLAVSCGAAAGTGCPPLDGPEQVQDALVTHIHDQFCSDPAGKDNTQARVEQAKSELQGSPAPARFTDEELVESLRRLRTNKTSGIDKVSNEFIGQACRSGITPRPW